MFSTIGIFYNYTLTDIYTLFVPLVYNEYMKSKWFDYKDYAISLRQQGLSLREIESLLNIPRSTLSGWMKTVPLTNEQRTLLSEKQKNGLIKARTKAILWHNAEKEARLKTAETEAKLTISKIPLNREIADLALAMLYMGEGKKNQATVLGSSDPLILKFFLAVLKNNYSIDISKLSYELHLRYDQIPSITKEYWSLELGISTALFKRVYFDDRTKDKVTYTGYMGVCVISCGNIAIQRKLKSIYNQFCTRVINDWAISSVG